jgi:hypothetical protein
MMGTFVGSGEIAAHREILLSWLEAMERLDLSQLSCIKDFGSITTCAT